MNRIFLGCLLLLFTAQLPAQKVLQIEKFGKAKTKKVYLGETVFIKTKQYPDTWFEATLDDLIVEAQAIVFYDRIVPIKDIISIKFKKDGFVRKFGGPLKFSGIVPATYEVIYGLVEPPIDWEGVAFIAGGAFILGSIMELFPARQFRLGKKRRLRILDLTFYPTFGGTDFSDIPNWNNRILTGD